MIRSARRPAWAARPRAAAATVGVLATLLTLLPVTSVVAAGAAPPVDARVVAAVAAIAPAAPDGTGDDPAPAGADDEHRDAAVRVVLDDVEPAVAHVGEPVTLRGRIVNDSDEPRRLETVTVRSAWAPLTSRADVTHWLEGRDLRETGWLLGEDAVGPVVGPGAEVPFSVQVPEHGLAALPGDLAALAIEIEAAGEVEPTSPSDGSPVPADGHPQVQPGPVVLRTVLTAARTHGVTEPLDVAWVVPLTLPADPALTSRDDEDRHEAWLAATGPGSPPRTWLENLTLPGVTWMVDPSMLVPVDPADDLAEGAAGPDRPVPGQQGPQDDDSTTTTEPPDAARTTGTPEEDPAEEGAATTGPDRSAATAGPRDTRGGDDAAVTTSPDEGPDDRLEDGEQLGGRPSSDRSAPATADDVHEGLVALRGLLGRAATEQLWWTPPADPDVAALLTLQSSAPTVRAAMDLQLPEAPTQVEQLLRRGRSDVAWPALDAPTPEQVATLDRFWATRPATPEGTAAVIVPRESLSGGSNTSVGTAAARVQGSEGVVALGADTRGAALLARADADAAALGEGAVVQRLLADSLTSYLQDPFADRSMLYAPPRGSQVPGAVLAELTEGFGSAPWTRTVSAAELLTVAAATGPVALSGVPPTADVLGGALVDRVVPAPSPLDARLVTGLTRLDAALVGLTQVLGDSTAVQTWEPVVSHLWSTRWRGAPGAWSRTWQEARRPVVHAQRGVHVNPSTVNFLSDQGLMQVTVVNDLPVPVEGVQVELVPDRNLLRVVQQPEPISIGAESRATVSFTARAVTRGTTTVSARLTTPNGTVLGDDAQVSVRVQPTGVWIYWVLGTIAGLVLVLGLVRSRRTEPRSVAVAASTTRTPGNSATTGGADAATTTGHAGTTTAEENR